MNKWETIVQLQILLEYFEDQNQDANEFEDEVRALNKAIKKLRKVWKIPKDFPAVYKM